MRQLLINGLLFLLPFLMWVIYVRAVQRGQLSTKGPWLRLAAVGVVLIGASVLYLRFSVDAPADSVYVPSHMEDGQLVKGKHVPAPVEAAPPVDEPAP